VPGTNFIGTTDGNAFMGKVNNQQSMLIDYYPTGTGNVFIGYKTGLSTTGIQNVGIGINAMLNNVAGYNNVAIGSGALQTNISGIYNVAIGINSLSASTASSNVAVGGYAFHVNTGTYNVAVGNNAGQASTTDSEVTAIGYGALANGHGISYSTAVGSNCLASSAGIQNTGVGRYCLSSTSSGTNNVGLGFEAGTAGTANTVGSNNTYLGSYAGSNANNYSNSTALGYQATITASNQMVFGNSSVTALVFHGDLEPGTGGPGSSNNVLTSKGAGLSPIWSASVNVDNVATKTLALGYVAKTSTYTINSSSDCTVDCNGAFAVTLPTAAGIAGQVFNVKNSGSGLITVNTTASQTIDGALTQTLNPRDSILVQSTGTNYIII
jgi:hypothetical protein